MALLHSLMNIVDEAKDELNDNTYKLLCDKMMELNKIHNDFYKVYYVITSPVHETKRGIRMALEMGKKILQLSCEEVDTINTCLESRGACVNEQITRQLFRDASHEMSTHFIPITDLCCECDGEESNAGVELRLLSSVVITKIEKLE
tara:strand:- start:484 stop:924 length:441 start_codon:yes stop_codon:yes gene_type:complete